MNEATTIKDLGIVKGYPDWVRENIAKYATSSDVGSVRVSINGKEKLLWNGCGDGTVELLVTSDKYYISDCTLKSELAGKIIVFKNDVADKMNDIELELEGNYDYYVIAGANSPQVVFFKN